MMTPRHYTVVLRLLFCLVLSGRGGLGEYRENLWTRDAELDGLTSSAGVLWVQDGSISEIDCARTCQDNDVCRAVFYNSRTRQCEGHSGTVTSTGATSKADNVLYLKLSLTAPLAPPTPPLHMTTGGMEYDLFVSGARSWYDAEATCDSRGQRLIRLDTDDKVNSLKGVLALYPMTLNKDVYVAGIGCCLETKIYWHSGQQDFWKNHHLFFSVDTVYTLNSGSVGLQFDDSASNANLFVCETK